MILLTYKILNVFTFSLFYPQISFSFFLVFFFLIFLFWTVNKYRVNFLFNFRKHLCKWFIFTFSDRMAENTKEELEQLAVKEEIGYIQEDILPTSSLEDIYTVYKQEENLSSSSVKDTCTVYKQENKPVFGPEIHTDIIIKDECEDIKTGN